jgi:aquaporin Z
MFGREKIAMLVAEFIGTFVLASAVLAMIARTNFPFFAAVTAGGTLGLMTLLIGNVSGAHLNPAVTLGLWTRRQIGSIKTVMYIAVQLLGGLAALTLAEYLINSPVKSIAGDKFEPRVLVAEIVGTFLFTFGVAAALSQGYKGLKQAFTIGGSLTAGIIVATFASNGLLNPAVALSVQSWSYSYAIGPVVGSILGMGLYGLLFAPRTLKQRAKAVLASKTKSVKKAVKKTTKKVTKKKK